MALFFAISGYYSPGSLERKGARAFLKDKFKRIGLPSAFCWFILGPTLQFAINCAFGLRTEYQYNPAFGPAWFLVYLLWFNVGFVVCSYVWPCSNQVCLPGLRKMFLATVMLGVAQWLLSLAFTSSWEFALSPNFDQTILYITFFATGVIAKRNHWWRSWKYSITSLCRFTGS